MMMPITQNALAQPPRSWLRKMSPNTMISSQIQMKNMKNHRNDQKHLAGTEVVSHHHEESLLVARTRPACSRYSAARESDAPGSPTASSPSGDSHARHLLHA